MDLTLTGELAQHLITMTRKDGKLAEAMARQYLKAVPTTQIADYLLTPEVALRLLAERLRKNPELTLRQLQALAGLGAPRGPRAARGARPTKARAGKRIRLSASEVDSLKGKVRTYLGRNPWSNRKQLFGAVAFPSLAVYNRILGELRESGEVQADGEKSKTRYALRGAKAGKAAKATRAKPAKRAKKPGRKPGKGVKKAKLAKKVAKAKAKVKTKVKKGKAKAKPKAKPRKVAAKSASNVRTCPVPGCTNRAAPRFGMLCKEHKDIPKAEREKYFAARRAAKAAPQA